MDSSSPTPNVLIIITDQQRADLTGREGYPLDVTPFVDSLARSGTWFGRAYTTSPVCSPARTSLLTGRYPSAHRVTQNAAEDLAVRSGDVFSVAREAGYCTALIGKNHTYIAAADVDQYVEFSHGGQRSGRQTAEEVDFDHWLNGLSHRTGLEPAPGGATVQNPYRIVSHAMSWIDSLAPHDQFLMEVSFPEPHNPYQAPTPYFDMFPPDEIPPNAVGEEFLGSESASDEMRYLRKIGERGDPSYAATMPRARSNYLGMLRFIDDQIKRLVNHLAASGRLQDTLILVMSDHGDYFGEYGLMRKGVGVPEVLIRVPLVAYGWGVTARSAAAPSFASLADILPTICDYLAVDVPEGVQGRSLRDILTDRAAASSVTTAYAEQGIGGERLTIAELDPDALPGLPGPTAPIGSPCFDELNAVTQAGRIRMVRDGDWKLTLDSTGNVRLFDLSEDPFETIDLSGQELLQSHRARLVELLARWSINIEDELPLPRDGYARRRQSPIESRGSFPRDE